jgi:hypothetical protein
VTAKGRPVRVGPFCFGRRPERQKLLGGYGLLGVRNDADSRLEKRLGNNSIGMSNYVKRKHTVVACKHLGVYSPVQVFGLFVLRGYSLVLLMIASATQKQMM